MRWRYQHSVLAACCLVYGFYHTARQVLPPAMPLLKDQLGLNYAQAGFLASAYDLGFGATVIIGGYLADRVRKVPLIAAGLVLLSLSLLLTTLGGSFEVIAAIRILTGIAFSAYFAAGVSLLSAYFPENERGKAIGIHMGGAASGKLIAPLLAALILPSLGWRPLFFVVGIPVLVIAFVFWRVVREPPGAQTISRPVSATMRQVFLNRSAMLLGLCGALIIAGNLSMYSFLPLYIVKELGAELSYGGLAIALMNGASIPVVPIAGLLSDRFGRKVVIATVSIISAFTLSAFPLLADVGLAPFGILLLGVSVGTSLAVVISYTVDVIPVSSRSFALGTVNAVTMLGGSLSTIASGHISDAFGIRYVFVFVAALAALSAVFVLFVTEPSRAMAVEERA
ncbi:MAG: MFS transporter [Chloroflexi bacterium]|nr:MFS transporter [Chloroflexota bacterium]